MSDMNLVRDYADHGSEAAFTELVRRHIDLVYPDVRRRDLPPGSYRGTGELSYLFSPQQNEIVSSFNHHESLPSNFHCYSRDSIVLGRCRAKVLRGHKYCSGRIGRSRFYSVNGFNFCRRYRNMELAEPRPFYNQWNQRNAR